MPSGLDVAVLGCGPVGLAAAIALSRAGHRCRLYERFPEPAPVGSGLMLQPTGLGVLDRLDALPRIHGLGQRVHRLLGRLAGNGRTILDVSYDAISPGVHAISIHRAALFDTLMEGALSEGVPIRTGIEIGSVRHVAGKVHPVTTRGLALPPCDLVVDALGARSPLASCGRVSELPYGALWAALPWPGEPFSSDRLEQRYRAASVMVGVLPIGRPSPGATPQAAFFWSLRRDRLESWRSAGLDAWKAEVRGVWPEVEPFLQAIEHAGQLTFASYSHRTARHVPESRVAHVGDAFHSTSPQLGQGVNMGLLDVEALVDALAGGGGVEDAIRAYARRRRLHVGVYQGLSRSLTPFYQSDSRMLCVVRDRLVPPLAGRWPARGVMASMVAGTLGLSGGVDGRLNPRRRTP